MALDLTGILNVVRAELDRGGDSVRIIYGSIDNQTIGEFQRDLPILKDFFRRQQSSFGYGVEVSGETEFLNRALTKGNYYLIFKKTK